jgi:uncharacterized protein (TIGR02246 family)
MTSRDVRATSPVQVIEHFGERLNRGDLDALLDLYEPEAAFVPEPGTLVRGLDAIREALKGFLALELRISGEIQSVVETGGLALVLNSWRLEGTDPTGGPVEMSGVSADVVRRQPDGSWRVLIDDPYGGAAAAATAGGAP